MADTAPVFKRRRSTGPRELRLLTRKETAARSIGELTPSCDIFGFSKGQFSLIDLLEHVIAQTGPARLSLSTWTAAHADVIRVHDLLANASAIDCRWLVDFTFQRRAPAIAAAIRERFGPAAIRVTRNHAKFALVENNRWRIVVRTSMNLNMNPRFEDFQIADDPALADFLGGVLDGLFAELGPGLGNESRPQTHKDRFADL